MQVIDLGEGVFCSKRAVKGLKDCSTHSQVARDLMACIFSDDALVTCSLKGGSSRKTNDPRPGLDPKALLVLEGMFGKQRV